MSREEQFDFYWKEIFDGLAYNPIEFNVYRFDQSMSLPSKFNKLYEMLKVLALNNQEVMDYLKEFVGTFDEKLYETIEDVLTVWLEDGRLSEVVRVAISEEVIEARTDYLDHTYLNLKDRLDLEREEVVVARGVSQTLGDRLNESDAQLQQIATNVLTLGVTNDGADTSSLINTFITEHTGEPLTLFFPKGSYLLTETIVLKENITIVGSGVDSTIFYTNTEITNFFNLDYEHNNVHFKDLTLLGSGNQNLLERGIFLLGTSKHANVVVNNCKFKNLTIGIQTGANGLAVSQNIFENISGIDTYGHAILCVSAKNITVENNYFVKVKRHCIYFSAGTKNSRFVNNTCLNSNGNAIRLNAYLYEGHKSNENITITGNLIDGVKPYEGQNVDGTSIIGGLALTGFMENITITDNIIKNVYNSFIYINCLPDYDGPFLNVVVSNNVLKNSVVSGVKLNVTGGKNFTIANNIIDDFISGYGISLSDVESGLIPGNIVKTGGMFSIKLFSNTSKITVSKNQTSNGVNNESLLNNVYLKIGRMDDYLGTDLLQLRNHLNSLITQLKVSGYMNS